MMFLLTWHIPCMYISELESLGLEVHIKRDDLTSCDLSGNKVRKLEFLLSEAIEESHDCVITIGTVPYNCIG